MSRDIVCSLVLGALLCGGAASCVGRDPPSIDSHDPDRLIPAIKAGVNSGDRHIIPYLVKDLESDDAAVRMYAIDGLRRMTGKDMGFVYYADLDERQAAIGRWKQWMQLFVP